MTETNHQGTQTAHDVFGVLMSIHSEILSLKTTLDSYVSNTNNKISQICDEMVQMKKQLSVHHSFTDQALDDLKYAQYDVRSESQNAHEHIQKRLQGIFASIKSLHEKRVVQNKQRQQLDHSVPQTHTHEVEQIEHSDPQAHILQEVELQPSTTTSPRFSQRRSFGHQTRAHLDNKKASQQKPISNRTLIIGSSIVKAINPRGLDTHVDRYSCPGAIIPDIGAKINQIDMGQYSNVVVYVGGNDVSSGKRLDASHTELYRLTRHIQSHQCRVHLCTVSPRQDADVTYYNEAVRAVCNETGADLIDTFDAFVYSDGGMAKQFFMRDGVHLSRYGSQTLVRLIHRHIHIVKRKEYTQVSERRTGYPVPREHCFGNQTPRHSTPRVPRQDVLFQNRFGSTSKNRA